MHRLFSVSILAAMLSGCGDSSSSSVGSGGNQSDAARKKDSASNVSLNILDYEQIQELIKSKQGKVVVMDAWSTSCQPCIKEFPHLVELHNEYGPEKVACISLSFDYEGIDKPEDQQERVLAFLRKQNATFDNVLNKEEADELYEKMDLSAIPAVFVYDQAGKLVQRFDDSYRNAAGERFSYKDVDVLVAQLLASEKG